MSDQGPIPTRRAVLAAGASLAAAGAFAGRAAAQGDAELARVAGARRILLKGGVVLTLDRAVGDFAKADVLIENGKISAVRPDIAAGDAVVVDAANRIVMPGFIDSHHHFYQGILRNILSNGLLNPDYNRDISNALTAPYQPADVYAGTLISALGMIDMGTTAAVDTSQVNHTPEHSDAGVRALQDSGLRVVYAYSRGAGPAAQYPQDLLRLRKAYFSSEDQLLTLALGGGLDREQFAFARKHGVRMVSHGVRDNTEKVLFELAKAKLLGAGDEYIHCTHLSSDAWRLLKDTGGEVSLAVPIEMAMGHGMPPIQEAIDHGIRPSLCFRRRRDHGAGPVHGDARLLHAAAAQPAAAGAARRKEPAAAPHHARGARIRDRRRRALSRPRQQDRHADARQGGRYRHARDRPAQRLAAQQRAGRGGEPDEPDERRHRVHRRQGEEMARRVWSALTWRACSSWSRKRATA